jgi:lysine/ornithine N-monooxygenase
MFGKDSESPSTTMSAFSTVYDACRYRFTWRCVVLGSGQSAAEVFIDLFDEQQDTDNHQFDLHWFTRSQGFFPMEYAPLGLEHFSPDYAQHFYDLTAQKKEQQLKQQALLYKGLVQKPFGKFIKDFITVALQVKAYRHIYIVNVI